MRILLNEDESQKWLFLLEREKTLERTSRFPTMPLTSAQKAEMRRMHKEGMSARDIANALGVSIYKVGGVVGGHPGHPQKGRAKSRAVVATPVHDRMILDGRKSGHDAVQIADTINREIGGHWMPADVAARIEELQK